MKGLCDIDRFKPLRNDINLLLADVICMQKTNAITSDNFKVNLKDFDIKYKTQEMLMTNQWV